MKTPVRIGKCSNEIVDKDGMFIAQGIGALNAKEIVHRVNCFDELLEAAKNYRKAIKAWFSNEATQDYKHFEKCLECVIKFDEAIAKAEQ